MADVTYAGLLHELRKAGADLPAEKAEEVRQALAAYEVHLEAAGADLLHVADTLRAAGLPREAREGVRYALTSLARGELSWALRPLEIRKAPSIWRRFDDWLNDKLS